MLPAFQNPIIPGYEVTHTVTAEQITWLIYAYIGFGEADGPQPSYGSITPPTINNYTILYHTLIGTVNGWSYYFSVETPGGEGILPANWLKELTFPTHGITYTGADHTAFSSGTDQDTGLIITTWQWADPTYELPIIADGDVVPTRIKT